MQKIDELLVRLQARDECQRIEAKETQKELGKSTLETISAFSNEPDLGGGYLVFKSDRYKNTFDLILLPHHLLGRETLEWLSQFKGVELSDARRRALAFVHEVGVITNQDYRQLNATDTLGAGAALRTLRDAGLLIQNGKGTETYYSLSDKAKTRVNIVKTPEVRDQSEGITPQTSPLSKGLAAIPEGFPQLSKELKVEISNLPKRGSKEKIKEIIVKLCSLGPLQPGELGRILGRNPQYLRDSYLHSMVREGQLKYEYPRQPAHPQQAYKTTTSKGDQSSQNIIIK